MVYTAYRCEIRDNYIHHAGGYGGGGQGYGVTLSDRTDSCLVEDNIFRSLRHAMMVKVGASGNVFGYNYSLENVATDGSTRLPDVSLHGHYPSFNLFEGNVVQDIHSADYWGPSGPGNTFFRNRVESGFEPDRRGIRISDHSHRQNVVGNEVVHGVIAIDRSVQGTLLHGNLGRGLVSWNPGITDRDLPSSYYLAAKPSFFGTLPWPSTGADRSNGTNPAKERYRSGNFIRHP
jgi:hypothetical protein